MRRFNATITIVAFVLCAGVALDGREPAGAGATASTARAGAAGALSLEAQRTFVTQYCAGCHSDALKSGGLTLAGFDAAYLDQHPQVAEKMIRKLRAGLMPPPAAPRRPDAQTVKAFTATLETRMDEAAAARPNPGRRLFQRLNRAEYGQAIHDLLDLDVDVDAFLPADTISNGFDNIADMQSVTPLVVQGYLRAASHISRLAVGDRQATPSPKTFSLTRAENQLRHVEGTPVGTRGGISVMHVFPADGDYEFKIAFFGGGMGELFGNTTVTSTDPGEQIEISLNGERVALFDVDGHMNELEPGGISRRTRPVPIKAGPQRLSAAFITRYAGPIDDLMAPIEFTNADPKIGTAYGITTLPHLRELTVTGPYQVSGVSETPSRRKIFTCQPATPSEEAPCAGRIVKRLAAAAYRGSATAEDMDDLMRLYAEGRRTADFETGVRHALQGILANPRFLLRIEEAPPAPSAAVHRISDLELASRLSFFLWSSVPDAELVRVATQGTLKNPAVLETQVRRMLADRRSKSLSTRFAGQWLRLQDVTTVTPDPVLYPKYDQYLAESYVRETQEFFDNLVREDRSLLDLLTADYSFVNGRIARQYGIPNVVGNDFRRVALPPERRGLLGQGSMLLQTSAADRTSPVQRGKWIMEVLLGSPPPPPPPDVPAFEETKDVNDGKVLNTRERMERHRANPVCASCHRVIDPPGLALENFDVTGQWRVKDNGVLINAASQLFDGSAIDGPAGLRTALLNHADVMLSSFTENLLTYALGRRVEYYDMPAVRAIVRAAAGQNNRLSAFVLGVVRSAAFQMSSGAAPASDARDARDTRTASLNATRR